MRFRRWGGSEASTRRPEITLHFRPLFGICLPARRYHPCTKAFCWGRARSHIHTDIAFAGNSTRPFKVLVCRFPRVSDLFGEIPSNLRAFFRSRAFCHLFVRIIRSSRRLATAGRPPLRRQFGVHCSAPIRLLHCPASSWDPYRVPGFSFETSGGTCGFRPKSVWRNDCKNAATAPSCMILIACLRNRRAGQLKASCFREFIFGGASARSVGPALFRRETP